MTTNAETSWIPEALIAEVSPERLMEYTGEIARWVRLSGTEDERKSFHYIQGVLDDIGLETRLLEHDAYVSLPGEASLWLVAPEEGAIDCITHSMAAPTEGLEGEVAYVGAGVGKDLAGADVRGKIALADGLAMPTKVKAIEGAGAIAQIHVSGEQLHEMIVSTVWGNPTPETLSLLPSTPVVSIGGEDGRRLAGMAGKRSVRVRMQTDVDTGWRPIPLLVADLFSERSDDFVMLSGHVDSWHYGAMDNGTANATMLEVARLLAVRRDRLARGLRLCFWSGHSHGRYAGSAWFADSHHEELYERCVAHVNVDSVGGRGANVLTEGIVMQEAKELAAEAIAELAGQKFEGTRPSRAGDQSFWGIGIPSMFMSLSEQPPSGGATEAAFAQLMGGESKTGGLGWWWHTPEDTVDKIDPDVLVRDARIYAAILYRLTTDEILPFDYVQTARELRDSLEELQEIAGDRIDLSIAVRRAGELERRARRLGERVEQVRSAAAQGSEVAGEGRLLNQAIKRLGRTLIPIDYSLAGPYDHDLAMPVPVIPVLDPLRRLARMDRDSDEAKLLATRLLRERNRVTRALGEALETIAAAVGEK